MAASTLYRPVAPTPPDFHLCDQTYGSSLSIRDCINALNYLPGGSGMIPFQSEDYSDYNPTGLPLSAESGSCRINVEAAGPHLPRSMLIVPNNLRSMASWVIGRCVITGNGQGGFITSGLSALVNYVIEHNLTPLSAFQDLPTSTAFITITVCNSDSPKWGKEPGNTDPAIAEAIGQYMHGAAGGETTSSEMKKIRSIGGQMWELASTGMLRSSSTTWWLSASQSSAHDEMTYECDTSLGSPVVADCAQVEWNQLGPPSDTLTVGPQNVHFLHSNTCFVAISASVAILLDWNQVRTAVSTIMNICIQNPIQPSQGGRAYYKSASRTRRRDNRPIQITGSNALPPNTNITIFQQQEPWTNPTEEMLSCTWEAVQNRSSLTKCLTA